MIHAARELSESSGKRLERGGRIRKKPFLAKVSEVKGLTGSVAFVAVRVRGRDGLVGSRCRKRDRFQYVEHQVAHGSSKV
jgi:hypothetical protein